MPKPETSGSAIPFLFSPGYRQPFNCRYMGSMKPWMDMVREAGLEPVFVGQDWKFGDPESWVRRMVSAARKVAEAGKPVILGGFSFGGATAFKAAEVLAADPSAPQPVAVVGASTSPVFGNAYTEFNRIFPAEQEFWHSYNDRSTEGYGSKLPLLGDVAVQLYMGTKETVTIKAQAEDVSAHMPDTTKVIEVRRTGHDFLTPEYMNTLHANLGALANLVNLADTTVLSKVY